MHSAAGWVKPGSSRAAASAIEDRFAENQYDRLPALAADLVARKVAVIAATGGPNSVSAAKASTTTIPVVFTSGADPVVAGFVASLNRPGGNLTGITWFGAAVSGKALGMLHELIPTAAYIALMVNPKNPESERRDGTRRRPRTRLAGSCLSSKPAPRVRSTQPSPSFVSDAPARFLSGSDPFFTSRRQQIVALAARDAIPSMYANRKFVADGGLMSYGTSITGRLSPGRRLCGANSQRRQARRPAGAMQPRKFELVINLKTAKALGLDRPADAARRAPTR